MTPGFMWINWRPAFDPKVVRRELQIIKEHLHRNAISIGARDRGGVATVAPFRRGSSGFEVLRPESEEGVQGRYARWD